MEGSRRMADDKDRSKLIETIQHFRLIDDTYFNAYMDDNTKGMRLFLRVILNEPALEVLDIQTQREVSNIYGRSVRFDVFVRDTAGVEYNLEVQRSDAWATPERARFNSSMMDTLTVKKGFEWGKDHLPPVHVIFITEHDVLKGGKPIYHSYRTIAELDHQRLDDHADVIYVNASYQDDSALGRLMHDMFCTNPDDMYYEELAERSRYFKKNEHGVMKMCEAMEKLMEEDRAETFNKGLSKGIADTTMKIVRNLLAGKEMSYEKIAKAADTSVDEVIRIANESGLAY